MSGIRLVDAHGREFDQYELRCQDCREVAVETLVPAGAPMPLDLVGVAILCEDCAVHRMICQLETATAEAAAEER